MPCNISGTIWNVHLVDDCIDSTHISREGSKETTTQARAQRHQQLHPISILSLARPLIKSGWNPDQIDRYICPTDIHHSNQKPSSTCMLCTTSHPFVYNQCPQLKNLTGTCQRHHHCVICTLKSGDFLHELQVLWVAPCDDTTIYPDICQWHKKGEPPVGHRLHRLPVALLPLQSPPPKHVEVSTNNDQGVSDLSTPPFTYHKEKIFSHKCKTSKTYTVTVAERNQNLST